MKHLFSKYRLCGAIALMSCLGLTSSFLNNSAPLSIGFGTLATAQTASSMSQIESIDFTVGRLVQTDRLKGHWVEYDFRGQERYRFKMIRQDSQSVLLRGENGGVDLLVDLSNKAISGEWANHPMAKLYTIANVQLFETALNAPQSKTMNPAVHAPKTAKNEKVLDRIIPKIMSVKNSINSDKKEPAKKPQLRANAAVATPTLNTSNLNPSTPPAGKVAVSGKVNTTSDNTVIETEKPHIDSDIKSAETEDVKWPIESNIAAKDKAATSFIPSSKPSNINIARYDNGRFETDNGILWTETTADGNSFKYKKIGENSDQLFLYNDTRNVFIQIDVKEKQSLISQNGESLRSYYVLTEVGALTKADPIISTANTPLTTGTAPTQKARFEIPFLAKKTDKLSIIERSKCLARGGKVERAGILNVERCTLPYSDGGKLCIDSSNCSGKCVVDDTNKTNGAFSGICQIDDNPFGCYSEVVAGEAQPKLCVD